MSYQHPGIDIDSLESFVVGRLRENLAPELFYHCPDHTLDVLQASRRIAKSEGLPGEKLVLLEAAALLHDTGFLFTYRDHEEASVKFAKEILPKFGFSDSQLPEICSAIMATRIPQTPESQIGRILCDADLDYLGRNDFYSIGETLFRELSHRGAVQDFQAWNKIQIKFLEPHSYWTETNRRDREPQKQAYLSELREKTEQ